MSGKLKQYFPTIWEEAEILEEIHSSPFLEEQFEEWTQEQQKEFLDICTGVKGVKILYDTFFKEIMDPEYRPERLNRLLSLLLGKSVEVEVMLQNDSPRIAGEKTLLSMDLVVRFEDGSIANIEVQRIAYRFPGERGATYSADLLLRQYRHVRKEFSKTNKGKRFDYRRLKNVYTIVLFENSPKEFRAYPDTYLHWFEQKSDTGLKMNLLQKYLFIPLDIFGEKIHNEGVSDETEAWLAFLSQDDPEIIVRLTENYPEFRVMYEEIYRICRNMEDVMRLFSEELRILDENTVMNMIDDMREEEEQMKTRLQDLKVKKQGLEKQTQGLEKQKRMLEEQNQTLEEQNQTLEERNQTLKTELERRDEKIALLEKQSKENRRLYEEMMRQLEELQQKLAKPSCETV